MPEVDRSMKPIEAIGDGSGDDTLGLIEASRPDVAGIPEEPETPDQYARMWQRKRRIPDEVAGAHSRVHQGPFSDLTIPQLNPPVREGFDEEVLPEQLRLEDVVRMIGDGANVSAGNHYRFHDPFVTLLLNSLIEVEKRNLGLAIQLLYFKDGSPKMDALIRAIEKGVITRLECGGVYGSLGSYISKGNLPFPVQLIGYGARAGMLRSGQITTDWLLGQVPYADQHGKVSGIMGPEQALCGNLGLLASDAAYARYGYVGCVAQTGDTPVSDPSGVNSQPEWLVNLGNDVLDNQGISGGTTDIRAIESRLEKDPIAQTITDNVMRVINASGVIKDGINFQAGAGTVSLATIYKLATVLEKRGIRGGFSTGGLLPIHLEMLRKGLVSRLFDGQAFNTDPGVFKSFAENPNHVTTTPWDFYAAFNSDRLVQHQNLAVLGALEIDRDFNANVLTGRNGIIRGGLGGAQDAASSQLTIITTPLINASKSTRTISPKIVPEVAVVTTVGSDVDVVVTEEAIAINPRSRSPYIDQLRANAVASGLTVLSIEDLAALSLRKAQALHRANPGSILITELPQTTDKVVAVVHDRWGRVSDVVRQVEI